VETAGNQKGARALLDSDVERSRILWNHLNYDMSPDPAVWLLILLVVIDNDYRTFMIVNLLISFFQAKLSVHRLLITKELFNFDQSPVIT